MLCNASSNLSQILQIKFFIGDQKFKNTKEIRDWATTAGIEFIYDYEKSWIFKVILVISFEICTNQWQLESSMNGNVYRKST